MSLPPSKPNANPPSPRGWYFRGYLWHLDAPCVPQVVTFRLRDSLPRDAVHRMQHDVALLPPTAGERAVLLAKRIERFLDSGAGECLLREPRVAHIVEDVLLRRHDRDYDLHSWCVMPNHVHVLVTPADGVGLATIVGAWKSIASREINRLLGRHGSVWQREHFDRYIRDQIHFDSVAAYIDNNPVKAGLCERPEQWPFGSASRGRDKVGTP